MQSGKTIMQQMRLGLFFPHCNCVKSIFIDWPFQTVLPIFSSNDERVWKLLPSHPLSPIYSLGNVIETDCKPFIFSYSLTSLAKVYVLSIVPTYSDVIGSKDRKGGESFLHFLHIIADWSAALNKFMDGRQYLEKWRHKILPGMFWITSQLMIWLV